MPYTLPDPIHQAIRLTAEERGLLATRAFRRLRRIRQLSLMHLLYPGASHSRLEHSLGVMELATRIFDVITDPANVLDEVRRALPELSDEELRRYWRRVVRVAALCHDLGHLPFSHAAERAMLPPGWTHEQLTRAVILDDETGSAIDGMKLRRLDVAKTAVGAREAPDLRFSAWEKIVSQIIVANAFGADRIDYLLRDPRRAGTRCPGFDHLRLIGALRILPSGRQRRPSLGMLDVGLGPAESLVRARHFLFSRVFHQQALCAYDVHFGDFLGQWLPQGQYPVAVSEHLEMDDDRVAAACDEAARDGRAPGHDAARRMVDREPFKLVYRGRSGLAGPRRFPGRAVYQAARRRFGPASARWDSRTVKSGSLRFPVQLRDGSVALSTAVSRPLARPPAECVEYVFVDPKLAERARRWLDGRREVLAAQNEEHLHGCIA
jgi:hypothetical protein